MRDLYSESVLASYVTYKELYANDNYRSAYQILAEFIKYILASEEIYSFSAPELKKKMQDVFGFQLPNAVLKSTIKKIDYVQRISGKEEYSVNRQNIKVDETFTKYKEDAERTNIILADQLTDYANKQRKGNVDKKKLIQELIAYLLDESCDDKYQEIISAFILEESKNEQIVNQLNAIREGSILYLGLNCNITETGSITKDLTLYLDMEILFDIYGYNGEVFQSLAKDLIALINDANREKKKIKLKYFEDTKREISNFFTAATEIVRSGAYLKENVAMKAIVNGCKDSTDVADKESDFFYDLQHTYGILPDDVSDYYTTDSYESNLEEIIASDPDSELGLRYLSNINKLRKNQVYYEYTQTGYLFVTETWKNIEMSKKIAQERQSTIGNGDDRNICGLAVSMNMLTNILWYKLNRGFGARNYPQNLDSVIKAKTVLARFISQNVTAVYNRYRKEYMDGDISAQQMAGRLLGLREKASKPEDITIDNLTDNLNFNSEYLSRYEEERELQKIQLKEKEELIQQITTNQEVQTTEYQSVIAETNKKLEEVQCISASQQKDIDQKNAIINSQKTELMEKDELLKKYHAREERNKRIKSVLCFIVVIALRFLLAAGITFGAYMFAKYVKADAANTAAIVVGIVSTALSAIGTVKNDLKKFILM